MKHPHLTKEQFIECLREPLVWAGQGSIVTARQIHAFDAAEKEHQQQAKQNATMILSLPAREWRLALATNPQLVTVALLQEVVAVARSTDSPRDAIEITTFGLDLARLVESAPITLSSGDLAARFHVISMHRAIGEAWREHAEALRVLTMNNEGLEAASRAEEYFRGFAGNAIDCARLSITRATILRQMEQLNEALVAIDVAVDILESFPDHSLLVNAKLVRAAILFSAGRIREALTIWRALERQLIDASDRETVLASLLNNIGHAFRDVGDFDSARLYLCRALAMFTSQRRSTSIARARWGLAQLSALSGNAARAVVELERSVDEMRSLSMTGNAAEAELELLDLSLALGYPVDPDFVCSRLIEEFTRAGMPANAIAALAYLRKDAALRLPQRRTVHHVRRFIAEVQQKPSLVFIPPVDVA